MGSNEQLVNVLMDTNQVLKDQLKRTQDRHDSELESAKRRILDLEEQVRAQREELEKLKALPAEKGLPREVFTDQESGPVDVPLDMVLQKYPMSCKKTYGKNQAKFPLRSWFDEIASSLASDFFDLVKSHRDVNKVRYEPAEYVALFSCFKNAQEVTDKNIPSRKGVTRLAEQAYRCNLSYDEWMFHLYSYRERLATKLNNSDKTLVKGAHFICIHSILSL